jgi:hypothetical protein
VLQNSSENAPAKIISGPNPTIKSYNASVIKIYNAKSGLERFENKNIFFYFVKMSQPTKTLAL